ncbi:MAG: 16S rRNA (adenine(1518)-N(6)/adenine(1519)-N(6))-dimethyltransferase RsmA [Clostridia bacterium]|nr:16S rRNA (adenine(1518)-N(6)/adenine(1519)-N(6))-dimethyltransferase RsmA [Clostridia bacterium]
MKLTNPSELKTVIERHGFSFTKSLGQNFLIDENILNKIIEGSGVGKSWGALEIGPGAGTLTRELAKNCGRVVAVEIDKKLMPLLSDTLGEFDNVEVINEDVMKLDLKQLVAEKFGNMPVAVVANLPYYITTPIIMGFLENEIPVSSLTVMIQKEVAERMVASPGGKDYGALSAAVQFYTRPKLVCRAEPHCFMPQPKVASVVIRLEVLDKPGAHVKNREFMFSVIKSAFGQRRKTLVNALSKSPYINIGKDLIIEVLDVLGIDQNIRGEKLGLEEFAKISDLLEEKNNDK